MRRFFPKIEFVNKMPEEKIEAVMGKWPDRGKGQLVGCYTRDEKEILILRGRGFRNTLFTIWHELSHWAIDFVFIGQMKGKADKWFDKHFTSKES